jgi:predicted Rossmann fold nucleotide-binding protein DprA/Smf involved in DNA uptake
MNEVGLAFTLLFGIWGKRQIPACSWKWWGPVAEILTSTEWEKVGGALRKIGLMDGAAVWEDEEAWEAVGRLVQRWRGEGWEPLCPLSPRYPARLRARLGWRAPALLWGKDCSDGMQKPGIALVGSRNLTEGEQEFAWGAGVACARRNYKVISGGARGADQWGASGCFEAGGFAVHFLPGGRGDDEVEGHGLLTVNPEWGAFDRLRALQRNRWIYASAEIAVVVSSRFGEGGAWAGALEALRSRLCPLVAYRGRGHREGNEALIRLGARGASSLEELEEILETMRGGMGLRARTLGAW